ncbi:MAG: hypothetical protein HY892_19490 [Deltaproteobacteria bacterium]|nr:hypothetical protein [Deltaproteobacteria bacterium]
MLAWCLFILGAAGCATLDEDLAVSEPGIILDTGTFTDRETQWRGMVLGGPFHPPVSGNVQEISRRAGTESIRKQMPVVYLSLDGRQRLEAVWLEKGKDGPCHLVRERRFQDGQLVREEVKKVCP